MKKTFLIALAVATGTLVGCGDNAEVNHKVEFLTDSTVYQTVTVLDGKTVERPADPEKEGFVFTNWFNEQELINIYDFSTPVTSDLKLYAGFDELVTVTFDLHGGAFEGEVPTTKTVTKGMTITKPTNPVYDGYDFVCWSTVENSKADEFRFSTPIEQNMTLHAVWEEVVIQTIYDVTGSSQSGLSHRAEMAADDDIETYWQAANKDAQTLEIDLGEVKAVNKVSQEFVDAAAWTFTVKGSFDGQSYYEILSNSDAANGTKFESTVTGYYRYIKLEIAAEQNFVATSKEFRVESSSLDNGVNVFYAYKGVADCWSGGYETEKMFDGKEDTMYCASDGVAGHWYGASSKTTEYFVNDLQIAFHDSDVHQFSIDVSKKMGAEWPNLVDCTTNTEEGRVFTFPVNDLISGALVHYNGPRWANADELRAFGYKVLAAEMTTAGNVNTYELDSLARVGVVELSNKDAANISLEISTDGVTYAPVTVDGSTNLVRINEDVKFVRYSSDDTTSSIRIFGVSFLTDLVLGKMLEADDGTEAGYYIDMATMNKECEQGVGRFYCRHEAEQGVVVANLGNQCYIDNVYVKVQDPQTDNVKLRVEVSNDGETYESLFDSYETPISGQNWTVDVNDLYRYVRVSIQFVGGFTNINTLSIFGYGSALL